VCLIDPPIIEVCEKNFVGIDTTGLPETDVLDHTVVMEEQSRVNAHYCAAHNLRPDERIPIARILADCV
jgi:hypothetical protein